MEQAKHNGKFIAVKKLLVNKPETTDIDAKLFQNEVLRVMSLSHPNIVRLVGYCSTTVDKATKYQGKPVFAEEQYRLICFEYLPNRSLDKYVDAYVKGMTILCECDNSLCPSCSYLFFLFPSILFF